MVDMTGKGSVFKWTPRYSKAFKEMKSMVDEDTMLIHPNFSKPFIVHTKASDYQIGGVHKKINRMFIV